jgi:hypothetical protein
MTVIEADKSSMSRRANNLFLAIGVMWSEFNFDAATNRFPVHRRTASHELAKN